MSHTASIDLTHNPVTLDDVEKTGPGTLAGRYLRRFWHPILMASDLGVNKARPIHVLGESFTLYRGSDGTPRLTEFRCPHRGTQLTTGTVEGDSIRCLYHGWRFDGAGKCVEQPGEPQPFLDKVRIRTYPVQEYLGLIFCFLGDGAPPPLPRYSQFDADGAIVQTGYVRECNYFQNMENSVDEVHVAFTHRTTALDALNFAIPRIEVEETDYGLVQYGLRPGDKKRKTHFVMPNILVMQLPPELPAETGWRDYVSWRVPIDDFKHMSFFAQHLKVTGAAREEYLAGWRARTHLDPPPTEAARRILDGELSFDDVAGRPDLPVIQDHVTQIGQGAIADRSAEHLGRSDIAIVRLRRIWRRELEALAAGEPLSEWKAVRELEVISGV
jgi:5,5'-dehydrodivanillate O-demethylase